MIKPSDCETYVYHMLKQPDGECVSRSEALRRYKKGWTDEPGKYPPGLRGIWYRIIIFYRTSKYLQFIKKYRVKIILGVIIGVLTGIILSFVLPLLHPQKEDQKLTLHQQQIQSQPTSTTVNPKKSPPHTLPSKKSDTTISHPTITAQNSNIFIGSNTGTVNQTINNPESKPLPFKERLVSCLDEIDKKIIPALRAGNTSFEGKVLPYQLTELQKLSAESEASNYITLTVKPGFILTKRKGTVYSVKFILSPTLLDN